MKDGSGETDGSVLGTHAHADTDMLSPFRKKHSRLSGSRLPHVKGQP